MMMFPTESPNLLCGYQNPYIEREEGFTGYLKKRIADLGLSPCISPTCRGQNLRGGEKKKKKTEMEMEREREPAQALSHDH
jgi:hypothetical protein